MKESAELGRKYFDLCAHIIYRLGDSDLYPHVPLSKVETFAVMMADSLRKMMIDAINDMFYQPAQDYLAELWDDKRKMIVNKDEVGKKVTPEEYIEQVMKGVKKVKKRIEDARKRDLPDEVLFLHDELWGMFMNRFDDDILDFATRLYNYGNELLRLPHTEETFVRAYMDKFMEIRQELIDQGIIGENWLTLDGLAAAYIYEHARRKFDGRFN